MTHIMRIKDINYQALYVIPRDDFAYAVLTTSLRLSDSVDCMFGFFDSEALRSIAPGLAEYLVRTDSPMRLIVSPNISTKDIAAIREGVKTPEEVLQARLRELLGEAKVSASALVNHTLECLAYLLSTNRLQIRVAWLKNGGLFHPKVWFFRDHESTVVAHGSSNFTASGLARNHEQIRVEASWGGDSAIDAINSLTDEFNALWNGTRDYALSLDLPATVKNDLLREYSPSSPPSPDDFVLAWNEDAKKIEALTQKDSVDKSLLLKRLEIPQGLNIESGPFAHQGKAVLSWEAAGRRGILAMATGSGKTIAALAAATRLQNDCEPLLIIVSAPYRPLISQWVDEVAAFGVDPLPAKGSARERTDRLDLAVRSLLSKASMIQIAVITEDYLTSSEFRTVLDAIPGQVKTVLIADEVHNLGRPKFISNPPERFDYRLGLSATPERQYDPEGTQALFNFFGDKIFEFSLGEALAANCLVPYNYYIHRVSLAYNEFEEWQSLTEKLRRMGFGEEDQNPAESGELAQTVKALLIKRRKVVESAENKVLVLKRLLAARKREEISHTLVYATDKGRKQLHSVNRMLQNDLRLTVHQLTAKETQNKMRTSALLDRFATGEYHAITCMKVLDEGVDVPQVCNAYLLASNTVRRQWIQRRGRILRRCDEVNKKLAHLHDFVVIPPDPRDRGGRTILNSELDRVREFAELAMNAGSTGGPFDQMEQIMNEMWYR